MALKKIVGLDRGHYNDPVNTGTAGYGLIEKELNNQIYHETKTLLKKYGIEVVTADGPLAKRDEIYNKKLPNNNYLIVSIHHDGNSNKSVNGTLALISIVATSKMKKTAEKFMKLLTNYGFKYRLIWQRKSDKTGKDYYSLIKNTKASCLICENCTLTSKKDTDIIKKDKKKYIEYVSESLTELICEWYGVKYKKEEPKKELYEDNEHLKWLYDNKLIFGKNYNGKETFSTSQIGVILKRFHSLINNEIKKIKELGEKNGNGQ